MFVARLLGLILLVVLAVLLAAYFITRDPRYAQWVRRLLQFAVAFACVFMALYVAERLMLVI
ncbi:MAG: hypothetical protein ACM3SS_17820 [Rhodospirillaceae bacterium]